MSERVLAQPQRVNVPVKAVKDSFSLEHREKKESEQTILSELLFDIGIGTFAEPRVGFDFSLVPALTGMERQKQPLLRTNPTSETAEPITETPAPALIVEDSAADLAPGQMKKSEFLSRLKIEVCRTVEAAIAGTGRTTDECPYIDYWFDFYSRKESAHIERTIHRYAPEAANVTTASDYIPVFTQRARQAAETWARTGEITGVPEGLPIRLPGMGLLGGIGRLFSGIGSIFFKARNGGARKPDDPREIQAELGEGRPLNSGVRSRMESAFAMDFAHVRTHTDTTAARLSTRFNARAFTVGEHIAFGSNEYQPGTLIGDALIAHELAHVVQQNGAKVAAAPMPDKTCTDYTNLEKDADNSAIHGVISLWSGIKTMSKQFLHSAKPSLQSGLRLQRCEQSRTTKPGESKLPTEPVTIKQEPVETPCKGVSKGTEENHCCTSSMIKEIEDYLGQAIPRVRNAISRLSNPESVSTQLENNFNIRKITNNYDFLILSVFKNILEKMNGTKENDYIIFVCQDDLEGGGHPAKASNCPSGPHGYIYFFGKYDEHTKPNDDEGKQVDNSARSKYLYDDPNINWVKVMIHEFAHVSCTDSVHMLGEDAEYYKNGNKGYPPETEKAIRNPDSYAWFAMEVS